MFFSKCSKYYVGLLPNLTLKRQTTRQMFPCVATQHFLEAICPFELKISSISHAQKECIFVTDYHANAVRLCSGIEKSPVKENT